MTCVETQSMGGWRIKLSLQHFARLKVFCPTTRGLELGNLVEQRKAGEEQAASGLCPYTCHDEAKVRDSGSPPEPRGKA